MIGACDNIQELSDSLAELPGLKKLVLVKNAELPLPPFLHWVLALPAHPLPQAPARAPTPLGKSWQTSADSRACRVECRK